MPMPECWRSPRAPPSRRTRATPTSTPSRLPPATSTGTRAERARTRSLTQCPRARSPRYPQLRREPSSLGRSPPGSRRAHHHGSTHDKADSEGDVSDFEASEDSDDRVKGQSEQRSADTEEQRPHKGLLGIRAGPSCKRFSTLWTGNGTAHAVVLMRDRPTTGFAMVNTGLLLILGSSKLRCF